MQAYQHKRKRDAIESGTFERDVRAKLTPKNGKPVPGKSSTIKLSFFVDEQMNRESLKRSVPRTTVCRQIDSSIATIEPMTSNKLLRKLLVLESLGKKDIVKSSMEPEDSEKRRKLTEKANLNKESKRLFGANRCMEKDVISEFECLVNAKNYLEELSELEERAKEELRKVTISKMTLGSEVQERLDFMRQAIHQSRLNLSQMRRYQNEKRKAIKMLTDSVQKIKASALRVEEASKDQRERFMELRECQEKLDEEISYYKGNLQEIGAKVMQQNREYFKENNKIRILKEQIHCVKGGPKVIGVVVPINTNNNPFEYETYFKLTNMQTISLVNPDKFSIKLSTVSPNKKQPAEPSLKWVYSSNSFNMDKLIYETRQLGFYNYDFNKKLYSEVELFIKLLLYGDGETILRKLSFNRPEFKRILGIEKLVKHMNINSHIEVKDNGSEDIQEETVRRNINMLERNSIFANTLASENKAVILFFGVRNLNVVSKLSENIYNDLVGFDNEILKVNDMKFRIDFLDRESQKQECTNYETFASFLGAFDERAQTELYQTLMTVTFIFEVKSKSSNTLYTKKLHLIFMDVVNIENYDRFVRQFKALLNKEKIITAKDKFLERIENYVKGVNRFLMIGELPNLIRKGVQAQEEYIKLRNAMDIMIRIKK